MNINPENALILQDFNERIHERLVDVLEKRWKHQRISIDTVEFDAGKRLIHVKYWTRDDTDYVNLTYDEFFTKQELRRDKIENIL